MATKNGATGMRNAAAARKYASAREGCFGVRQCQAKRRDSGARGVVVTPGNLMAVDGAITPRQLDHHTPPHRALPGPPSSRQSYHPQVFGGLMLKWL
jgi:hypothetical protein